MGGESMRERERGGGGKENEAKRDQAVFIRARAPLRSRHTRNRAVAGAARAIYIRLTEEI